MNWSDHLCRARFELLEGDGDERQRLTLAAEEFRAALAARASWSPQMQRGADDLRSKLLAADAAESVSCMGEESVREVSDDLWRFCEVAEPCPWDAAYAGLRGIEHLREARFALNRRDGDSRERLRSAAGRFRAAVLHVETWPDGLRAAAQALSFKIFRHDDAKPEEAVRRMGDKTAGEISQDILRLCDDADLHEGDTRHG